MFVQWRFCTVGIKILLKIIVSYFCIVVVVVLVRECPSLFVMYNYRYTRNVTVLLQEMMVMISLEKNTNLFLQIDRISTNK